MLRMSTKPNLMLANEYVAIREKYHSTVTNIETFIYYLYFRVITGKDLSFPVYELVVMISDHYNIRRQS